MILSESKEFIYADENELWSTLWSHGVRRTLEAIEEKLGKDGLQRFQAEVFQHLKATQQTAKYSELLSVLFGFATKYPDN